MDPRALPRFLPARTWLVRASLVAVAMSTCFTLPMAAIATEELDLTKLPPPAKREVKFADDIAPLLARCYDCHGADEQSAGLRLDRKSRAMEGGDSGPVIRPQKSADSRLVHVVSGAIKDLMMPPPGEGEPLTTDEVALLRAWIDSGAAWPDDGQAEVRKTSNHWSFQPIVRPGLPAVQAADWPRNPIDFFILQKLEAERIAPSPAADKATLLRRIYLDLTGLPPSPMEVTEFLADTRADAYERVVDRLLASPHYAERWARHWLDAARYADSDGYEKDLPRPHAWRYREWVIDAIHRDVPFDQFTIEQLAGDLLEPKSLDLLAATGFHRNTLTNREGGIDPEEDRTKKTVDRTNTTASVWLGLTYGCANCHTHKYDPITQREYFALYAFFDNVDEKDLAAPLAAEQEAYAKAKADFDRAHAPLAAELARYEREELAPRQQAWEASLDRSPKAVWEPLEIESVVSAGGAKVTKQKDGSWLVGGKNPATDTYTVIARTQQQGVTGLRLDVLPDKSLGAQGPGRTPHGNFVLSEVELQATALAAADAEAPSTPVGVGASDDAAPRGERPAATPQTMLASVAWQRALADFEQTSANGKHWPASAAIDGKADTGWAVSPRFGEAHQLVLETKSDLGHEGGTRLTITLKQEYGSKHAIGRFKLSLTTAARPISLEGFPAEIDRIVKLEPEKRSKADAEKLAAFHRQQDAGWRERKAAVDGHLAKAPKSPGTMAQTLVEHQPPRATRLHIRGDFLSPSEFTIAPDGLEVLPPLAKRGDRADRLDLARWLVSPANPLTPRVAVNRVWQRYFGRGIVPTSDDFGTQGEPPSHPELLDWLASEFVARGWSLKQLHKLIVTSSTYRQSSAARPELIQRDPYNAWLARQHRLRVEAEVIRDLALAASGLLERKIGGPSVRPPQPAGIADLGYASSIKWVDSKGSDRYRRGLYTFFQRTVPYPMLMTFDAPDASLVCTRRERSNTPLQSLTLWNDPVFVECAQGLAKRVLRETPPQAAAVDTLKARLDTLLLTALGRHPTAGEWPVLRELYESQRALAAANPAAAEKLAGAKPWPDQIDAVELATWVVIARTVLNLDEFITRE